MIEGFVDVAMALAKMPSKCQMDYVVPCDTWEGMVETIKIMADPRAYEKLKAGFADEKTMTFDSVDGLLGHFNVTRD
jgi:hypothetical protein